MRLLIAEDDKALGLFLSRGLEADGHRVRLAADGGEAVEAFRQELPDLTILDLNMPVKDGEQVLDEVRMLDADLPVLVLTGRLEVDTRVRCLDHGADDLMTKPFSLQELRARCRALLRRKRETRLLLRAGDLELDRLEHNAKRAGRTIVLTNKEFALLEHLLLNRGQCVTRVELLDTVWNLEPAQTTNIVDVYVNYLRRKLEDPPPGRVICTVRGRGYSGHHQHGALIPSGHCSISWAAFGPPYFFSEISINNPVPLASAAPAASRMRACAKYLRPSLRAIEPSMRSGALLGTGRRNSISSLRVIAERPRARTDLLMASSSSVAMMPPCKYPGWPSNVPLTVGDATTEPSGVRKNSSCNPAGLAVPQPKQRLLAACAKGVRRSSRSLITTSQVEMRR